MTGSGENRHPYHGQRAVLSTKHGKERVVAPALMAGVGLVVEVADNLDTDALGTFTGEIPRVGTMREVAVRKARLGMAAARLPLGLASEGSFGPHPLVPFVPGDRELLVLVDDQLGIEVAEEALSMDTNFAHRTATERDDLGEFLRRVRFPSHGLIVRPSAGPKEPLFKGITTVPALREALERCARASDDGLAHVETDMRAHMNPMRQAVIGDLAQRLGRRLRARCSRCGAPGWGRVDVIRGLPCELCGFETDEVREEVEGCPRCDLRLTRPRSDGRTHVKAENCPVCNP